MYNKGILAVILSLMIAVSFSCCVDNTAESSGETVKTVEIVDMAGRTVEVPENVEKIVCSGPGALRLVTYLQALDMLVGVESCEQTESNGSGLLYSMTKPYAIANAEYFKTLPVIGSKFVDGLNPEKVISVNPDIIIVSYCEACVADDIQTQTGTPVVVVNYDEFESFTDENIVGSLTLLGEVLNKEERAEEVIDFFTDAQSDITDRIENISDNEKPSVYIGGLNAGKIAQGIESTSGTYTPFKVLKAKNVAESLGSKNQLFVTKEQILEWNPDIVFIDVGRFELVKEDYNSNPDYYNSLTAFKNGNVYTTYRYKSYMIDIGTVLANTYYIGTVLYPEEFSDIDPEEKADEIYTFLVGKPVYSVLSENYPGFQNINFSDFN